MLNLLYTRKVLVNSILYTVFPLVFYCRKLPLNEIILCDRIWENSPYGINAQFAQCAFLVPRVKNCQSSKFVIYMSKNLSYNCYRRLRRLGVTYQGEISLYFNTGSAINSCRARSPFLRALIRIHARGLSRYS